MAAIIGALLIVGLLSAVMAILFSNRAGISVAAWLALKLAPLLAPNLSGPNALAKAIRKDRALGAARPDKALQRRFQFHEETVEGQRVFQLLARERTDEKCHLLYLHGGAYVLDLQRPQWLVAAGLLERIGHQLIAPLYSLAPEGSWREGNRDVKRTYLSLVRKYGSKNIAVAGDSAGGGLALTLAQSLRDSGQPMPAALILFSPWLDVGVSGSDQRDLESRDPALTIEFLRGAGRLWANGLPPSDPRVSPLFGDHRGLPPTIVFSGTRDLLDSDALRLVKANPSITHRHYRNMFHVWPAAPIPEGRRALDEAASFIKAFIS